MVSLRGNGDFISMRRLVDHRVDGIIACISDENFTEAELREIERFNLPVVTIDAFGKRFFSENISSDEEACGNLPRTVFCPGDTAISVFSPESLASRTSPPVPLLPRHAGGTGDCTGGKFHLLLPGDRRGEEDGCAVPMAEDPSPPLRMLLLQRQRCTPSLRCGRLSGSENSEELSVIGTADLNFASALVPKLTTIRQNGVEIGSLAAHAMLRLLNADSRELSRQISNVTLVERDSVANLKKKGRKP